MFAYTVAQYSLPVSYRPSSRRTVVHLHSTPSSLRTLLLSPAPSGARHGGSRVFHPGLAFLSGCFIHHAFLFFSMPHSILWQRCYASLHHQRTVVLNLGILCVTLRRRAGTRPLCPRAALTRVGMAPKAVRPSSKADAAPRPVGLQEEAAPPPSPGVVVVAPQSKRRAWYKSTKGKKYLARAQEHRRSQQGDTTELLKTDPWEGVDCLKREDSRLERFRQSGDRALVARLAVFLLQALIKIVQSWSCDEGVLSVFGEGENSAPRRALLFHRCEKMNDDTWRRLTRQERILFMRAAKEGESAGDLEPPAQAEWRQDMEDNVDEAIQRLCRDVLGPAVLDGTLPPLIFSHPLCPSIGSTTRVGRTAVGQSL